MLQIVSSKTVSIPKRMSLKGADPKLDPVKGAGSLDNLRRRSSDNSLSWRIVQHKQFSNPTKRPRQPSPIPPRRIGLWPSASKRWNCHTDPYSFSAENRPVEVIAWTKSCHGISPGDDVTPGLKNGCRKTLSERASTAISAFFGLAGVLSAA